MANDKQEHTGPRRAVDKAEDAVGAVVGKASAEMGGGTRDGFVKNAVLGNLYEIEAAELALKQAPRADVRNVAQNILEDHRQSAQRLQSTLKTTGQADLAPSELDERRKGMLDNLRTAPSEKFEPTYLAQQKAAHEEAIALFENYAENGDESELKAFAQTTLPVLKSHLSMVNKLKAD